MKEIRLEVDLSGIFVYNLLAQWFATRHIYSTIGGATSLCLTMVQVMMFS